MKPNPSRPGPRSENPLAHMLASSALTDVVTYFVVHPDSAPHFRALQRATGLASRSLQNELARLEALGLLAREQDGRRVRYRATHHPRWTVLREMVRAFVEPSRVLRTALAEVPGLEGAFVFGSFARGTMDEHSDIDVLAIGDQWHVPVAELNLSAGTQEAAMLRGREVNVTRYTHRKLRERRGGGFLRSVLAGPREWLVGDEAILQIAEGEAA